MPDIENTGVLLLWGYNPSYTRLVHATAAVAGVKRGMRLIVVDPRQAGLANKADVWLRVRPGTDGACQTRATDFGQRIDRRSSDLPAEPRHVFHTAGSALHQAVPSRSGD